MKLVGYIRVSSESQRENTSLTEQRKKIEAYCYAMGHELVRVFEEVQSAKNTDRPEFVSALGMVRESADGIIAIKLDRIARNTRDVLALVEDVLQPANKALVLLDLQVDTSTPTGRMILTVMAAVATLERDVIQERTVTGRKAKSDAGGYAYGSPRFGQKVVAGELVADESEQAAITAAKRHKRSGKSLGQIAKWLNENGYKTKRGGPWHPQTVRRAIA
jgi:site-specific DNA recombinase